MVYGAGFNLRVQPICKHNRKNIALHLSAPVQAGESKLNEPAMYVEKEIDRRTHFIQQENGTSIKYLASKLIMTKLMYVAPCLCAPRGFINVESTKVHLAPFISVHLASIPNRS